MTNARTNAPAFDWGYSDGNSWHGTPCQRVEYRGLVILAVQDDSPSNPFEEWDTEPPTAVASGRGGSIQDYSDGEALGALEGVSDGWISRHWRALAKILGVAESDLEAQVKERCKGVPTVDVRRDAFREVLDDMAPTRYGGNAGDYFDALAAIWALRGVAAESWYSTGYSQGDWANGLSVATPAWAEKVGAPADTHAAQCKAAGKLWGAWAWGDCYGYVIAAPGAAQVRAWNETGTGFDLEDVPIDELTDLDSCWGYYGSEHAESGLEDAAREAADSILEAARRRRLEALRTILRNRVPTLARPAILARAGALESSLGA